MWTLDEIDCIIAILFIDDTRRNSERHEEEDYKEDAQDDYGF